MNWKKVNITATDIKKHLNKEFVGEYKGNHEIATSLGKQVIYNFTDVKGLPFSIYGFTNLNRVMEQLEVGTVCKIIYKGTEKVQTKFGLKDVHQVDVEITDDEILTTEEDEKPLPF